MVVVAVRVAGQWALEGSVGVLSQSLSYSPPEVASLSLDRQDVSAAVMDCSQFNSDGYPLRNGNALTASVVLAGSNFGTGDATVVTIHGVACALLTVSHSRIQCITPVCSGTAVERRFCMQEC